MGLCTSSRQRTNNNDIPIIQKSKMDQRTSNVKLLLDQYHKLNVLLDLVGNTDNLEKKTRDHINLLFVTKSNITILIQHSLKKIMKEKNISRLITKEDEAWLYDDLIFLSKIGPQFQVFLKVIDILFENEDFENSFPILSHGFQQMSEDIKKMPFLNTYTQTKNTSI
ncbi:unnamed protein product [Paramecium pentaurelia]|uniref:Uncharacterized protein n=1 Tax=Paramecium pentaurelia TaxID=43138 RepID=A0A8S1S8B1_9CILI|nr:unnamed protein product [Paramecium pentaurelia]